MSNDDVKCLFCGGDTTFLASVEGKVCLNCGDKLQQQGVKVMSMGRYNNLVDAPEPHTPSYNLLAADLGALTDRVSRIMGLVADLAGDFAIVTKSVEQTAEKEGN